MPVRISPKLKTAALALTVPAGLLLWLGAFACSGPKTAPPPPLPESPWGGKYAYNYDLPANFEKAKPGSVPITIAVVNPSYKEQDSALASPMYAGVGKGLSVSMGTDLDKILIAKGVTTTGPYLGLDEITYSQKKGAHLTLAPRVFVAVEVKQSEWQHIYGANRQEAHFVMNVSGWISFIMQEPMTGEKMWIKKLEIEPIKTQGVIAQESFAQYSNSNGCDGPTFTGYSAGKILVDGKADALATALKDIYPMVLEKFTKYLETDEMVELKGKGQEIRANKVYAGN
jgi:hypothetical protein